MSNKLDCTISDIAYILDSLCVLRDIYKAGNCNDCTNRNCGIKPKPGQMVRYNCAFYKKRGD